MNIFGVAITRPTKKDTWLCAFIMGVVAIVGTLLLYFSSFEKETLMALWLSYYVGTLTSLFGIKALKSVREFIFLIVVTAIALVIFHEILALL